MAIIEAKQISKTFGDVEVLKTVDPRKLHTLSRNIAIMGKS